MAFEASDETPAHNFDTGPVERLGYIDADGFGASDFLPTKRPDTSSPPYEASPPRTTYADPWRMQHFYVMDGQLREGEHPDAEGREAADNHRRYLAAQHLFRTDYLQHVPHVNGAYADELETVRSVLAADFGEAVADAQFVVLEGQDYRNLFFDNSMATSGPDMAILGIDSAEAELYGANYILRQGFHGGVHLAGMRETAIITLQNPASRTAQAADGRTTPYKATEIALGDLTRPIVGRDGTLRMGGDFLNEGFIDSYAVRRAVGYGRPMPDLPDESVATRFGDHGSITLKLGYAHPSSGVSYAGNPDGVVYLPYHYAAGVGVVRDARRPEGRTVVRPLAVGMAALSVDLLRTRAPDLEQAMIDRITGNGDQQRVADSINEIQPGLYEDLMRAAYSFDGLRYGMLRVLGALGLTDAPVGSVG